MKMNDAFFLFRISGRTSQPLDRTDKSEAADTEGTGESLCESCSQLLSEGTRPG
jgi:hypothetical protein